MPRIRDPGLSSPSLHSESETVSILIETVGAITRMGVLHEVASATTDSRLRDDLPVTVSLYEFTDVADGGAQIGDTESATSLSGGESLAASEVVDHAALLGESVVRHSKESPMGADFR
jgi:hypothetical protein